jgi:hypothetical protein
LNLLLAIVLSLDQRIEYQFPLVIFTALYALKKIPGTKLLKNKATFSLFIITAYVVLNSLVALTDPVGLASNWMAAPARLIVFVVLLIALTTATSSPKYDSEATYRTLEWLVGIKVLICIVEFYIFLKSGEIRERPLFNIILSADSLFGVRVTSSYDVLFSLFALSRRRVSIRLSLLLLVLVLTETRALLMMSVIFFAWRLYQEKAKTAIISGAFVAAMIVGNYFLIQLTEQTSSRLTQVDGSSLSDKIEQIEMASHLIPSPYIITGRGLGMTMADLIRDEARPYSYEAQAVVLLWQGGLLFYAAYIAVMSAYGGRTKYISIGIIIILGTLNPALFALASAFLLVGLKKITRSSTAKS